MAGIIRESVRTYNLNLKAGMVYQLNFPDTMPTTLQIRNFGLNPIYINNMSNVSQIKYEMMVIAGGTRVYTNPTGMKQVYLYSDFDVNVLVNSSESSEVYPTDLDQTGVTQIINNNIPSVVQLNAGSNHIGKVEIDTPIPTGSNTIGKVEIVQPKFMPKQVTLTANTNLTVKSSAGYVAKIESTITDIQLLDGTTIVWNGIGKIDFSNPIYLTSNITLKSATGGIVNISYL